jgi:hypothetical protein
LDRVIVRELAPIYYGRYVDDILLVMENQRGFKTNREVWRYIRQRTGNLLKNVQEAGKPGVQFMPRYLVNSEIILAGTKQKVFFLKGATGKALVRSIERTVRARASEWRALPDSPEHDDALAADLVNACGEDGEQVDNLRKTESLSLRRAALAIRLRDMEAFEQDLPAEDWKIQRQRFLETIWSHLLALPQFFDFAIYLPRIFSLAIACGDYAHARDLLSKLAALIDRVEKGCEISLAASKPDAKGKDEILESWRQHLARSLGEALSAALGPVHRQKEHLEGIGEALLAIGKLTLANHSRLESATEALTWAQRCFVRDMGRVAYRMRYFPYRMAHVWEDLTAGITASSILSEGSPFVENRLLRSVGLFLEEVKEPRMPLALLFPTRPFQIDELYLLVPRMLNGEIPKAIEDWAWAFRGFVPIEPYPGTDEPGRPIVIPNSHFRRSPRVAVTSWETSDDSWKASVVARPDPGVLARYQRLNRLMNAVLRSRGAPNYVVFPELSIPSRWFLRIASKLKQRGISLIAGVEYLPSPPPTFDQVANQVWASLISDFLGFRSFVIYRQDKVNPALEEGAQLLNIGGKKLVPLVDPEKSFIRHVVRHGDLHFGILVCSELTNVEYRGEYRGRVDALFVPEWNQDTETFSFLVEAAAHDMHAYIVQCNNRRYGDSRIRAPRAKSWERDIVRVKGGIEDYFVVGEIDVVELRRFQSNARSPEGGPFKPVPDGFRMDPDRKTLP